LRLDETAGDDEVDGRGRVVALADGTVVGFSDGSRRVTGALRSGSRGSDKSIVVQALSATMRPGNNP
jgi:copper oxidase (laccase) domain-containing protein